MFLGEIGTRQADLVKLLRRLRAKTPALVFAYEAGPTEYGVHRYLTCQGVECEVIAASLIPKKPVDKIRLTDVMPWTWPGCSARGSDAGLCPDRRGRSPPGSMPARAMPPA